MLTRADGSAKWVQDGTALLAAVHGPVQAGQRREDAERAVVEVVWRPRSGLPGVSLAKKAPLPSIAPRCPVVTFK